MALFGRAFAQLLSKISRKARTNALRYEAASERASATDGRPQRFPDRELHPAFSKSRRLFLSLPSDPSGPVLAPSPVRSLPAPPASPPPLPASAPAAVPSPPSDLQPGRASVAAPLLCCRLCQVSSRGARRSPFLLFSNPLPRYCS